MLEKTLQDRLRARADWYRGINRPVDQPRPDHDIETAELLEDAAREIDICAVERKALRRAERRR